MNVLIIQQYSMRSYENNEYLFDKDGHSDTMLSLIKGVDKEDYNFTIVVPDNVRGGLKAVKKYIDFWKIKSNVMILCKKFGINIDEERSDFDRQYWKNVIEENNVDLVINMNDVIAPNLATLRRYCSKTFKIYTILDHMPFYKHSWQHPDHGKIHRILESIDVSDRVFTYFEHTQSILSYLSKREISLIPAFSTEFLNKFAMRDLTNYSELHELIDEKHEKTLLASRLTDKTKYTPEAIKQHCNARSTDLLICNPNELNEKFIDDAFKDAEFPKLKTKNDFLKLLSKSMYMINTIDPEVILSSSSLQAIYYACELEPFRRYDRDYLMIKQFKFINNYSIEYTPTKLRRLYS